MMLTLSCLLLQARGVKLEFRHVGHLGVVLCSIHGTNKVTQSSSVLLAVIQLHVEDYIQICVCQRLPQRLVLGTDTAALALPEP